MTEVPRVRLQPAQHRIIRLYVADMPAQEIADLYGINVSTVRSHLRDARKQFKAAGYRVENKIFLGKAYFEEYRYVPA